MRQVPTTFLILGDGKVARHLRRYFTLEEIPFLQWARSFSVSSLSSTSSLPSSLSSSKSDSQASLEQLIEQSTHILFAVSDSAIESLYESLLAEHPLLSSKTCLHFSGALVSPAMPSAHPLMTFSDELYDLETYRKIFFVIEEGRQPFADLLPGLSNSSQAIAAQKKPLYHALCVLSGNFTVILWEKMFNALSNEFDLPREAAVPYLKTIMRNLMASRPGHSVLTGPLARGDEATIRKNLNALEGDPFAEVYTAFVHAYGATLQGSLK